MPREVLFIVEARRIGSGRPTKVWVFRTRRAARKFAALKEKRAKTLYYDVSPAAWGPESM